MYKIFQLHDDDWYFPSADLAVGEGLLACGGDLSTTRLINAYAHGIFPWYMDGEPLLWWSLNPRMIIRPGEMKVSKSLRHTLKQGKFECRIDTQFREVMLHCAQTPRHGSTETWITNDMLFAYCTLHAAGLAHSFETYLDGTLVGGLYGVSIGKAFFGESMFHTVTDASKVAFWHLHQFMLKHEFKLIDCQQETEHLHSLGAYTVPRTDFLKEVEALSLMDTMVGDWGNGDWKLGKLSLKQPENVHFRSILVS